MPTISVIVPVYNTEPYIHRCVDSILSQTFTDFELLLVDDGSPDNCGAICDEYAEQDGRVKAFHQENRGQAAARNLALDWVFANSGSEYISFVDSDDWVHPKYLELLIRAIREYDAPVSQCIFVETSGGDAFEDVGNRMFQVTPEEQYLNWNCALFCTKLYRRSCFDTLRFPEGIIYEDLAIWYKLLFSLDRMVIVNEKLYYYFQNPDGTTLKKWTPAKLARVEAWEAQLDYLSQYDNLEIQKTALYRYFWILEEQCYDIWISRGIPLREKCRYDHALRRKMQSRLKEYRDTLRQMPRYRRYCRVSNTLLGLCSTMLRVVWRRIRHPADRET